VAIKPEYILKYSVNFIFPHTKVGNV